MDSRPFRLTFTPPGATSLSPSSTRLGTSRLHSRGRTLASDGYTRASSIKLDSDLEGSRFSSSREYGISDSRRSSWKVSSALTAVTSCDRPWADSPVGSRSRLGGSEPLGACSGFLNGTQDSDMKRAKISYCSRTPYSREPCSPVLSGAYCNPDPSWQVRSTRSRSSSSSSSPSEGGWSRREHDGLSMQPPRAAGLASSLYPERAVSSYAQGARPKESFTSGQASATTRRRTGHYEPSPLSRDPCRPATPWAGPSRSRSWYTSSAGSSETTAPRRQAADSGSPEGRCATRQLLSRLASSMSSTLFSRRPSQDSSSSDSASCSFDSLEDSADAQREESSPTSASSSRNSSTDPSQGLPFLRRRHHAVRETHGAEADPEPPRAGTSWLSSSLRSRCTPLFSCRRREGLQEDEARQPYRSSPFPLRRRASPETKATDQEEGEEDEEEPESAGVVGSPEATGASNTSVPCAPHASRTHRMTRVTPNSLFHVSVSPSLESSLPDNVMITVDIMATGRSGPEMEKPSSSRDPEKLRKIKESLLLEESDEEGDLCRICQMAEESPSNPLIAPCRCTGSLQYVHQDCMKKWLSSKISSGSALDTITTCELCKEKLQLNIDNFDINELYRMRERSENEFISCGLYLVVLLHLCEQRFSDVLGAANDAGFFNMARTLHEYMDELESSNGDSEEEVPDRRPAIHFCDLDDDDDEEDY